MNDRLSKSLPRDHVCEIMGGKKKFKKDKRKMPLQVAMTNVPQKSIKPRKRKMDYASQQRRALKKEANGRQYHWNNIYGEVKDTRQK